MDAKTTKNIIKSIIKNYIKHKSKVLEERVYWACIDKLYNARMYEDFEIENNI